MKLQKETSAHGKWYDDACGSAFALELIGERWSLLVIRELMFGARRFSDLRASLPGISAKVLTERLATLEQAGVLKRRTLPPPGKVQVYELTEWGLAAEPILQETGRWATMSSMHRPTLPLSPASLMMSMRTMCDYARIGEIEGKIGLVVGEDVFVAEPGEGTLPIARTAEPTGDAIFHAPNATIIAGLLYAKIPAEQLEREAGLRIEGDRQLALRYAALFALPEKIA